jgi:Tfp pilus assembly protein PilF
MTDPAPEQTDAVAADKRLAVRLLEEGQLTSAEEEFRKLLQMNTPITNEMNGLALAGIAWIALLRGDDARAEEYAREALQHDPASIDAMRVLATTSTPLAAAAWRHEVALSNVTLALADMLQPLPRVTPRPNRFKGGVSATLSRLGRRISSSSSHRTEQD